MGYVNVTDICQFVPPSLIQKTLGTWTPTVASNLITDVRTAADAAFDLLIPLVLPGSEVALQGAKIKSVDVWYIIGTAAADDFATVEVDKVTLPVDGTAPTGAAVSSTCDAAHDTAAERLAVDEHKMTVTITAPAFVEKGAAYYLHLNVDAAATTVFSIVGAQVNYTLRL